MSGRNSVASYLKFFSNFWLLGVLVVQFQLLDHRHPFVNSGINLLCIVIFAILALSIKLGDTANMEKLLRSYTRTLDLVPLLINAMFGSSSNACFIGMVVWFFYGLLAYVFSPGVALIIGLVIGTIAFVWLLVVATRSRL